MRIRNHAAGDRPRGKEPNMPSIQTMVHPADSSDNFGNSNKGDKGYYDDQERERTIGRYHTLLGRRPSLAFPASSSGFLELGIDATARNWANLG
jgi:hypothetical protein